MIEVEKKITLDKESLARIMQDAHFVYEKSFVDTYYDTEDYSLINKGYWLRSRDEKFELKVHLGGGQIEQFNEIEEEQLILDALNLKEKGPMTEVLERNGYRPFCSIITTRKKYKSEGITIDLDLARSDNFSYNVGELEILVEKEHEIEEATQRISNFIKRYDISEAKTRGKVIEFLKQFNPEQYSSLVKNGIIENY